MHKGFTRTTLSVIGAALLSGSVFAAGPTLSNLPTVIITDKAKEGAFTPCDTFSPALPYDGGEPNVLTAATENRYRFTEALNLADYVNAGESTLGQVNYLFEEFNSDASGAEGALRTGSARAIVINGNEAFTAGSVDRTAVLSNSAGNLQDDNLLSFVDQIRSGGDGSAPGPDPGGVFTDYALLKFYVASSNPATADAIVSMKTMNVITTNDDPDCIGDRLSVGTSIFTPEECVDDFVGWYRSTFGGLPDVSQNLAANATAFSGNWTANAPGRALPNPTGSATSTAFASSIPVTESPTPLLRVETDASPGNTGTTNANFAPQYAAWLSWRRDIAAVKTTVPVTANKVYMIRWTVSVPAAFQSATSPQIPDVRFRVGEATNLGIGQAHDVLPAPGANGIVGAGVQEHRSYFYAPANTPSGAEIGFMFDVFDFYQGTGGGFHTEGAANYGLELSKIEVFSFDRGDLQGANIEMNHGAATVTTADSTTPPSGSSPFTQFNLATSQTTGDWENRNSSFTQPTSNRNPSGTFAADLLTMSLVAGNHNAIGEWDPRGFVLKQDPSFAPDNTANEIVSDIPNSKLLFVDAWLSSPQATTANNHLPVMRVGFRTDVYGETGLSQASPVRQITQGRVAYIEFRAWNRTDAEDVGDLVAPTNALEANAKRYTAVMEPQIRTGSTIDVRPFVQFWSFPLDLTATPGSFRDDRADAGTMRIHRVVITSYDLPTLPDSNCP